MTDPSQGETHAWEDPPVGTARFRKKDFWSAENLKFSRPGYRIEKASRIINKIADGKRIDLLDIGCGPAALQYLLDKNINYYGIDIAINSPAPNLMEVNLLESTIKFGEKKFDIIVAQGLFEYMGKLQEQKFSEISKLLNDGGKFVVSYVNFGHREPQIYAPYSNVQPLSAFKESLAGYFQIDRFFPASHNWAHRQPDQLHFRKLQLILSVNIPVISRSLAVEYFFICSLRPQ